MLGTSQSSSHPLFASVFVKHGGNISAKVRQDTHLANNLEQGGLEVPITVQCSISSQKGQIMKTLKQLINKRWRGPRDFNASEHYNTRKCVNERDHSCVLLRCTTSILVILRRYFSFERLLKLLKPAYCTRYVVIVLFMRLYLLLLNSQPRMMHS